MISKTCWITTAFTVIAATVALPAAAWEYRICRGQNVTWDGDTQTFEANQNDFPVGSAWRASLENAVDAWNVNAPATNFRFGLVYNTAADDDLGDGRNSIVRTPDIAGAAVMVARLRLSACIWPFWRRDITEVDIVAENSFPWNHATNPNPFVAGQSSAISFMHELGHAFGLLHENDVMATMNDTLPNGGPISGANDAHPYSDDVAGNRAGYGTDGTANDLIVSTFRRTGAGNSARIIAPATVSRGNPTTFQFTVGNRGTANQTAQVRFYLSTNDTITTGDTQVGSTTLTINSGVTSTLNASINVPLSVTPGNYFFGYIIDPTNTIGETDEGNNAVSMTTTTQVVATSPPNACLTVTPTFGVQPLTVSLNASCSSDPDGTITNYHWNMGDGGTRTGQTATYTYFTDGDYTITLTVTDNDNETDTAIEFVFVACDNGGFGCEV